MSKFIAILLSIVTFVAIGATPASARSFHHSSMSGKASYYGPGFNGRRSANGQRFNQNGRTAAHKSLPFGTKLLVRNNMTHQAVVVTVTDRGPFVGGRVLDLSLGAARAIGMIKQGVARITYTILG